MCWLLYEFCSTTSLSGKWIEEARRGERRRSRCSWAYFISALVSHWPNEVHRLKSFSATLCHFNVSSTFRSVTILDPELDNCAPTSCGYNNMTQILPLI
jgi:hypothetical protein